ncbi:MAG TPA: cytochrome b5 domain-containing protein [Anaerovoracaceae bacterium]|nr:cytochrome b5 domain-containing protein [Anaerovoracaceae bacterium]
MEGLWNRKTVYLTEEENLMKITPEELAVYDGKDGRPAYVAVNRVIYDVTEFPSWAGGMHFGNLAGTDATESFEACHKATFLEPLKIVGKVVE